MFRRLLTGVFACAACVAATLGAGTTTNRFGFSGPEAFPLDYSIGFLHVVDLDGDGLNDIVVVNNARSKINLLYNRTGKTNAPMTAVKVGRRDVNELPADARFRVDSISSEKRITSLVIEDLNGDHRPDLAYYGDPKELVVQFNLGTNGWAPPRRWSIDDGLYDYNALTSGDVNHDGHPDLLLLAEKYIYILASKPDGTLGEPEKLPYAGSVKALQVLDLDGDSRDDLLLVNWDNANPFRFRLQVAPGQFGPEIQLPLAPIRSYWADDLDGDHRTEIITIAAKSGRAAVANFTRKPSEEFAGPLRDGQFSILPLQRTDKARRGVTWADLNGDGLPDLIVADPEGGQLMVHFQQADGTLAAPKTFPSFTGITDIAVADWDGDGKAEVFVLSADEKQLGTASLDANGRLPFPQALPLNGRPLAFAVGAVKPGAKPSLAVITEREDKRPGKDKDSKEETFNVRELVLRAADGTTTTQKLADSFKGNPTALAIHDANQDGLPDLVVLTPYEKIKVLVQLKEPKDGALFTEADVNPPGGNSDAPWLATADVDGDGKPELLLAQKNFLRAVVLASEGKESKDGKDKLTWSFTVRDQINGAASSSRIVGAAALPSGDGKTPVLFLLDADRKAVTVCTRDTNGVWKSGKSSVLPVSDFNAITPIALGGKTPNAIGFLGANMAAWKRLDGDVWEFTELDGYETPIKDGYLHDVTSGDLNGDGRKDLVFIETVRAYIDLVTFEAPHQLVPASRWPVFEERTFRNRRSETAEPRESAVGDVTGDGKNDLILIVHDRVLVYPQE
jgi:hypothetical protein